MKRLFTIDRTVGMKISNFEMGIMRIISVVVLAAVCTAFSFAQSGRRLQKKVEPIPTTKVIAGDTYSESRSYKPRKIYPPNYNKNKRRSKKASKTSSPPVSEEDVITVDSSLVTIPVSVYDKNGNYITNISKEEIKVFEDGKEQEIAYFRISEQPFTVALLLDTSPSTEYRIDEIRAGAKAFVRQLKPNDRVLVIEFDGRPRLLTKTTSDRKKIFRGIDRASFGGGTALYDAVRFTLDRHLSSIEGRKAIVLFTDGVDTVSRKGGYDSTLSKAEESGTIVFPVYYNTYGLIGNGRGGVVQTRLPGLGGSNIGRGTSAQEYALGKKYLDELAAYTGGRIFQPEKSPYGLTRAFEGIAEELRRQYSLGYYPAKEGETGQRKIIKVRIYRPKLVVRARDSYIVGASKQTGS